MINIKQIIALSFILIAPAFAIGAQEDEGAVQKVYYEWCAAIGKAKGNPEVVVKYYAPDAILLPTLSSDVLENKNGGLNDYFKKLTSHKDIHCVTKKLITRMYPDTAVNSGLYDFVYTLDDGETKTIHARFTFVYQKYGDKWLINKHHSSKTPK